MASELTDAQLAALVKGSDVDERFALDEGGFPIVTEVFVVRDDEGGILLTAFRDSALSLSAHEVSAGVVCTEPERYVPEADAVLLAKALRRFQSATPCLAESKFCAGACLECLPIRLALQRVLGDEAGDGHG